MKFDETQFTAAGLVFKREGDRIRIMIPGESSVCEAVVKDGDVLDLQPQRSTVHRALVSHMAASGLQK